jgi:NADPH-dependent 2,4-dienoyl-CoA reductase/sulfur reductase-like enzyme
MVIDAVRNGVGLGFPIEYRISGDELREGGYGLDEGVEFAKMIDGKVDLIHVSAAYHYIPPRELFVRVHPTYFLEDGCNVYMAAAVKKAVKTPVATVGGISDPEAMERIIASGQADVVAVARALIADHELPKKAAAGRAKEMRPCIRCLTCMDSDLSAGGRTYKCAVNPTVGREYENKFLAPPPARRKKVLIAGGGPGGMQAAITASERGHQAILCEKSSSLGGQLKSVDNVPFKRHVVALRKHLEYLVHSSDTVVLLNTEVTPEFVASQRPDALIAAVGAEPIVPNLPGMRGGNVIMADDLRRPGVEIGEKVVILGGGLVGCEEAVYLAMLGKDVTVIEMLGDYARDANPFVKMALAVELRNRKIKMTTNTKGKAVEARGLRCTNAEGEEVLYEADTIVCAVGQKALTHVVDQLRGTAPEFSFIGDCEKPRKIMEALTAGYNAAMDL